MITESELKELIEQPEKFESSIPNKYSDINFFQKAPTFLREDMAKCFSALRAFVNGEKFQGREITRQDVHSTYEFVEKGLFAYLLQQRCVSNRIYREIPKESLDMLKCYKKLKEKCESRMAA